MKPWRDASGRGGAYEPPVSSPADGVLRNNQPRGHAGQL